MIFLIKITGLEKNTPLYSYLSIDGIKKCQKKINILVFLNLQTKNGGGKCGIHEKILFVHLRLNESQKI